jgi:hypothetical protein
MIFQEAIKDLHRGRPTMGLLEGLAPGHGERFSESWVLQESQNILGKWLTPISNQEMSP